MRTIHCSIILGFLITSVVLVVVPSCTAQGPKYTIQDIGTLQGGSSVGRALGPAGETVGHSGYNHATGEAFAWIPGQKMQSLGTLAGGDDSKAFGTNALGQVVGYSNTRDSLRAFLWTRAGGMKDLGTLPGDVSSKAFGINN